MATKSSKTIKPSDAKAKPASKRKGAGAKKPAAESKSAAKTKRIRGTFSIPESDYALIGELKARLTARKLPAKKNQLLRAGLRALAAMAPIDLQEAIESLSAVPKPPRGK